MKENDKRDGQFENKEKKEFVRPELKSFGDVVELTQGFRDGGALDSVFPVNILRPTSYS